MAYNIKFTKADKVNGVEYAKGKTLSVSNSIYKKLKENGSVEDFIEPKPIKAKKEEE